MPLLEVEDVTVRFGGVVALNAVSLHVEENTIVGLIGPNGAGKSTLIGVLSGLQRSQGGTAAFEGHDLIKSPAHRRAQLGITRTFQRLELWDSMTVFENVRTAAEFAARWRKDFDPIASAQAAIDLLGLGAYANSGTGALPSGIGRLVEVARAMATRPRLMLLDEPSAGLDHRESENLGEVLASLVEHGDMAILLIEHHIDMVLRHCSDIFVLDFGQIIAHGGPDSIRSDKLVQEAYLGSAVDAQV